MKLYRQLSAEEAQNIRENGFRDDTEAEVRGGGMMSGLHFTEREPTVDDPAPTKLIQVDVPDELIAGYDLVSSPTDVGARQFLLPATLLNGPLSRKTFGAKYAYVISIDASVLLEGQFEGVLLVRLGSIANAILALSRVIPLSPHVEKQQTRDAVQIAALLAGHLCEFARLMSTGNGAAWALVEKGVKTGRAIPQLEYLGKKSRFANLDDIKNALTPGSELMKPCEHMRDKLAFHRDEKPFREWLQQQPGKVTLLSLRGPNIDDVIFDASYDVVNSSVSETERPQFMDTLAELFPLCTYLVDAAIVGFAVEKGHLQLEPEAPGRPARFHATTPPPETA